MPRTPSTRRASTNAPDAPAIARDPFFAGLAALCRSEPTRGKWVLVPSHAVGHTVGDRLARHGVSWANLSLTTPLDVAIRMAAPFLIERGIDPSEEPLGPALVMRLLLDQPSADGYFRDMAEHATLAEALWRTIRELRHAGVRAAAVRPDAFATPAKHREVAALLAAYEQHLVERRVADMPVVFEEAMRRASWCPIAADDLVLELPDVVWPPIVQQFLQALPGRRVHLEALRVPGAGDAPGAAALAASRHAAVAAASTDASRLVFLQTPAHAGRARKDGTLDLFHAGGRDAEIDEVCRRILASGRPLDEVEIACAADAHVQLAVEKAIRTGWPVTVARGMPAVMTRPGRLFVQFCGWVASGLAASELRALLQSGDCVLPSPPSQAEGEDDRLTSGQAARLLLKAQATWGAATYRCALNRLAAAYDGEASDEERSAEQREWSRRKAAQTRRLAAWVHDVLASLPQPDADGSVSVVALADAAAAFLEGNASRASAADAIAQVQIGDALRELRALGEYTTGIESAIALLRARVDGIAVLRDRPRPGHLHVSSLREAGFDGRPLVFVVGLQEGGVFPSAVEDPILLDAERSCISPNLRTSAQRLDEAVQAVLTRLAAIGACAEHVCLSFSCRDTREFRDTFPSWIVLQAHRLRTGDASLTYDDLDAALGEPASAVPARADAAVTDAGWWLATCASVAAARPVVMHAFPSLGAGVHAEEARDSDAFTPFDGYVPAAGPVLDPTRSGRAVSATTLEGAASCPFSFFLQQGLRVRPIEESRIDEDAWLTPLIKGSELHALFARFMRDVRDRSRRPDLVKDGPKLRRWGELRLQELRAEMPPPSEEVFARECRLFLEDLAEFLAAECEGRFGADPVGIEVTFGMVARENGEEPLASATPLELALGRGRALLVRGRIDRINRIGRGRYEVLDYKTGSYYAPAWKGTFAGGTRLQHALYGRAAERLLSPSDPNARVVRSVYAFPSVKGHGVLRPIAAPDPAALTAVLCGVVDVIGTGAFVIADKKERCRFCECGAACHAEDPSGRNRNETRAARKVDNLANRALDAYRGLREHD